MIYMMNKDRKHIKLNFVFMGDSRIRQQFYNFLKLIPDYDRVTNPTQIPKMWTAFHGDVDVDSSILSLRVSFKWRHLINDDAIRVMYQWVASEQTERPNLIFLGIEVYYMMQQYGANFQLYNKNLMELRLILQKLSNITQVIWLNQYPTLERYGNINDRNTDIHSTKIHHYNKYVHHIFGNESNIRIWDSGNPLAEEYVRGCEILEREIPNPQFIKTGPEQFINSRPYVNCLDFIHTGYLALSKATQLLYNDICNAKLFSEQVYKTFK
ncbi:N-acetylneuraminate 9-O-acetyltransferase-like [Daphnia pulicaria]|uniref:N-acetylneuraminate 9-O-acetyltransferase-like n=1 Tax=Daphnia pulicaria TaxID=35523 RepID=UPI001EEA4E78|nr:N-acetylneuraminate 9-O-acetyltransferase-like [Daphnia pulicaria]